MWNYVAIFALLIFPFSALPQQDEAALKAKIKGFRNNKRFLIRYDKFTDKATVLVAPFGLSSTGEYMAGGHMLGIAASFGFEGQALKSPPAAYFIVFYYTGKNWLLLNDRTVYLIADGERFKFEDNKRESDVRRGGVSERLLVPVPAADFERIANAKTVEVKVGGRAYQLKEEHLEAFRDLASLPK